MSFVSVVICQLEVAVLEGVLQSAVCLIVTVIPRTRGDPAPRGAVAP